MALGFQNATNITFENIENLTNITSMPEFAIRMNTQVYDGYLFIILLFVIWFVLFRVSYLKNNEILTSMMTSSAVVSVLSLLLRTIYMINDGVREGLLTDSQLWIFPIFTIILAAIVWSNKQ